MKTGIGGKMPIGESPTLSPKLMPGFPYFYHDLVARVIPGSILVFLLILIIPVEQFGLIQELAEAVTKQPVLFLTAFAPLILALGYTIGVIYEAVAFFLKKLLGRYSPFSSKFKAALKEYRHHLGHAPEVPPGDMGVYAWQAFRLFEAFEPLASHFYHRGTRFLAESKMASYSAFSLIIASPLAWLIRGKTWGFVLILISFIILFPASSARLRRFHMEVIACLEYLYVTRNNYSTEAQKWIKDLWLKTLGYQKEKQ
jgi:hypothetical protein